jgi:hypothetical protein
LGIARLILFGFGFLFHALSIQKFVKNLGPKAPVLSPTLITLRKRLLKILGCCPIACPMVNPLSSKIAIAESALDNALLRVD